MYVHNHIHTRGSGGMLPQEILDFRLSVTAPGAFSGSLYRIENCRNTLAISNRGRGGEI